MIAVIWAILGYLLGSIPFGIVITRGLGLGDLRQIGSGNIGATNVLRTGHKGAALATLLLDSGKGAIAVLLAYWLGGDTAAVMAGAGALLGHCFPVWLGFKGGKGVATFLGTLIALYWPLGLAACAVWLVTALVTRISSLSALVAVGTSPLVALLMGQALIAAAAHFTALAQGRRAFEGRAESCDVDDVDPDPDDHAAPPRITRR